MIINKKRVLQWLTYLCGFTTLALQLIDCGADISNPDAPTPCDPVAQALKSAWWSSGEQTCQHPRASPQSMGQCDVDCHDKTGYANVTATITNVKPSPLGVSGYLNGKLLYWSPQPRTF